MKKRIMILIAALITLSLCACGSKVADTTGAKDAQETEVSADRIMPEGLVDIYVSAGNVADFVFHADKSGIEDIKTIAYRFGEYEISLSDSGAGYQSSTWNHLVIFHIHRICMLLS